jgi:hypothetical protein
LRKWDIRIKEWIVDVGLGIGYPGRQRPLFARMLSADVMPAWVPGCAAICFGCGPFAAPSPMRRQVDNAEPMNLSEHGIATDAMAQFPGDLPGRGALRPSRFQILDALSRPRRGCGLAQRPWEADRSFHVTPPIGAMSLASAVDG